MLDETTITQLITELRYAVETCDALMLALQECRQEPMPEPEHLTTARAMLSQFWLYDGRRSTERQVINGNL